MITVLGASGFVGSGIVRKLELAGIEYYAPPRNEILDGKYLGDIIYCIGLTADFRSKPFETIEAHVSLLSRILQQTSFSSLTYLSSARIYIHNKDFASEESPLVIDVNDPFDIYNASKITGELLALNSGKSNIKIARLSNVFGDDFNSDNFITSLIKDALINNNIVLRTSPSSAKDYISLNDVVDVLIDISLNGKNKIYNVVSGYNVSNKDIVRNISLITGCSYEFQKDSPSIIFPVISNKRVEKEFGYKQTISIIEELASIIAKFKERIKMSSN